MINPRAGVLSLVAVAVFVCAGLAADTARAQIASNWNEALNSRARLVAGMRHAGSVIAGIEIVLEDGWKTYWRNPGDSGIPPTFDWSGSENLARADVLFPAPKRFEDSSGQSIGYKKSVILPVRIVAEQPGQPVNIALKVDYAVCAALCIPARAELTLHVPAEVSVSPALADSLARVPRDGAAVDGPRVREVMVSGTGKVRQIEISVLQPKDATQTDLFVEGPEQWYLPLPAEVARTASVEGTEIRYRVDLDALPAATRVSGARLRFTLVNAGDAVEQAVTLP